MRVFNIGYADWKALTQGNGFSAAHRWRGKAETEAEHEVVEVYSGHRSVVLQCSLSGADETDWAATFQTSSVEKATDDDALAALYGTLHSIHDDDGDLKVVVEPRPGSEKYFYTHNLCDGTTWFEGSVAEIEAVATDSGDQLTWNTGKTMWIDLHHGKVFKEDNMPNQATYDLLVEVSTDAGVSWDPKVEDSWELTDNDFTFDYETGDVVFNVALGGSDQVRASGYRCVGSTNVIKPGAGKRLKLEYVEVQYMTDIALTTDVVFGIFGFVDVFAPALLDTAEPPGPYPSGTLIPLVEERYKKITDFFQESTGPFPVIPAHGGPLIIEEVTDSANIQAKLNDGYSVLKVDKVGQTWEALMTVRSGDRAMKHPLVTLPFKYLAFRDLRASYGMEIRVTVSGDQPLGGTFASVTFYSTSENE